MTSFRQQLRDNAVALISLIVALSSLAYNTWRNERDVAGASPRTGGTCVLAIRDVSTVAPAPLPARAEELQRVWSGNWEGLGKDDEAAVNRIDDAIGKLREATLGTLRSLH